MEEDEYVFDSYNAMGRTASYQGFLSLLFLGYWFLA